MYILVCTAVICHRLGGLNSKYLFLRVLEAEKCKIKVFGEVLLFSLQVAIFPIYSHGREKRESKLSCVSYKDINFIHVLHTCLSSRYCHIR